MNKEPIHKLDTMLDGCGFQRVSWVSVYPLCPVLVHTGSKVAQEHLMMGPVNVQVIANLIGIEYDQYDVLKQLWDYVKKNKLNILFKELSEEK